MVVSGGGLLRRCFVTLGLVAVGVVQLAVPLFTYVCCIGMADDDQSLERVRGMKLCANSMARFLELQASENESGRTREDTVSVDSVVPVFAVHTLYSAVDCVRKTNPLHNEMWPTPPQQGTMIPLPQGPT